VRQTEGKLISLPAPVRSTAFCHAVQYGGSCHACCEHTANKERRPRAFIADGEARKTKPRAVNYPGSVKVVASVCRLLQSKRRGVSGVGDAVAGTGPVGIVNNTPGPQGM
jgi:hypothetical protein